MKPLKSKEFNWKMILVFILVFLIVSQIVSDWEYIENSLRSAFES
jgi:hypothetical protein